MQQLINGLLWPGIEPGDVLCSSYCGVIEMMGGEVWTRGPDGGARRVYLFCLLDAGVGLLGGGVVRLLERF